MPRFEDIPTFPHSGYEVNVPWRYLEKHLHDASGNATASNIELEPDFQRGHVWTEAQQVAFVEYGLMRGESSMLITANCPNWPNGHPYQLIDGLQRITAVRRFLRGEIRAFGHFYADYTDEMSIFTSFRWRVLQLPTRAEVLNLYLLLNAGGVVHSPDEIARVRMLFEEEQARRAAAAAKPAPKGKKKREEPKWLKLGRSIKSTR